MKSKWNFHKWNKRESMTSSTGLMSKASSRKKSIPSSGIRKRLMEKTLEGEQAARFGETDGIEASAENIKHITNIKTRRIIKLLSSTNNIAIFMRKASRTRTSLLKKYGMNAQVNGNNEFVLPTNNVVELNRTLEFFNEDIFRGIITDSLYRSNSKKKDNH